MCYTPIFYNRDATADICPLCKQISTDVKVMPMHCVCASEVCPLVIHHTVG